MVSAKSARPVSAVFLPKAFRSFAAGVSVLASLVIGQSGSAEGVTERISTAEPAPLLAAAEKDKAGKEDVAKAASDEAGSRVYIEELDLGFMSGGHGSSRKKRSSGGNAISLGGTTHEHGVGTHAPGELSVDLKGQAVEFNAMVGIDDETKGAGAAVFQVWVDGEKKYDSGVMHGGDTPKSVNVDLKGGKHLLLELRDVDEHDQSAHADWADAAIIFERSASSQDSPQATKLPLRETPAIAAAENDSLSINQPRITGATPGHPFLFRIPATGKGLLKFSAHGLPRGLALDSKTGIISGSLKQAGEWLVKLTVSDARGDTANGELKIVGGKERLALTPPMGWNSWNVFGGEVDDKKIRAAADWLVRSGLANHGFQYVNIDDGWAGGRDARGYITPNAKFPDMKGLADYVHGRGLKLGIYSSPGPTTCQKLMGSYGHEVQDAQSYARWGIDYLKYDWCSYSQIVPAKPTLTDLQKPYKIMRAALDRVDRDIVYSLCQYGLGSVWEWGRSVGGNLWRTTGDIGDKWGTITRLGFGEDSLSKYAGPGHWNDPDMLVVGSVGKGWGAQIHATDLNKNEQLTHLTLWSMLAAPLLIGCDLSQLDQFTIDLLSNDEVLAVDQDALGRQGSRHSASGRAEVWTKPLADGSLAVALFNRSPHKQKVSVTWKDLGLKSEQKVRDLWQHKSLGTLRDGLSRDLDAHAAALFKVSS